MTTPGCVRCGKAIEEKRRKYCSDACADSANRDRIKQRKLSVQALGARRLYRYYPVSRPTADAGPGPKAET